MVYITSTDFIGALDREENSENQHEKHTYLEAREDAADAMLTMDIKVFGSRRFARLLGVATRLEREVSGQGGS